MLRIFLGTSVGAAFLSLTLTPTALKAQAINVTPITIAFDDEQRSALLTITNQGSVASTVQVRPFDWRQKDGGNQLTPTRDLLVSPPMMQVGPGETQTVRIVLKAPVSTTERAYRLWIDQLPPAGGSGRINVLLRLSIPVFAAESGKSHPDLAWHVRPAGPRAAALTISNAGPKHAHLTIVSSEAALSAEAGNVYVLAGASQRIAMDKVSASLQPGTTVNFVASQDAAKSVVRAPVEGP